MKSLEDTSSLISYICSLTSVSSHANTGTMPEPLVQPILTPRFAISCTSECLHGVCELADRWDRQSRHSHEPRMRIQTHISENQAEVEHTLDLYPDADSYAQVYDLHGLLRSTTILAHAVYLSDNEIRLIKERKAGISHCPTSNFNLRSGVAPIGRYLDEGLKVCLTGAHCQLYLMFDPGWTRYRCIGWVFCVNLGCDSRCINSIQSHRLE